MMPKAMVLKGSEMQYYQNDNAMKAWDLLFLKVEKISERKKKEVDAKHLLFLWGKGTAKQHQLPLKSCLFCGKGWLIWLWQW